jgi:dolichol-phosphate mannosyltransferase
MKTVVVIPTYNEAENIPLIAPLIAAQIPHAEMLVMDDNSPDGTADIAETLFGSDAKYAGSRVVRRSGPKGLGRAYRDGFRLAIEDRYDRIIQMDADMSHDPSHLPALLEASGTAGMVIGSRYCPGGGVRNWPASRIRLSRFANWYVRNIARIPVADATAGFRCWTLPALESVEIETLRSEGYSFQVEMSHRACRAGLKIAETPIIFTDRRFGQSKISKAVLIESMFMPWRLRFQPWQASPRQQALGIGQ